MPDKLPIIKVKELIKILKKAGFKEWRQRGGHLTLYRDFDEIEHLEKKGVKSFGEEEAKMYIKSYQENLKKYKKLAHK